MIESLAPVLQGPLSFARDALCLPDSMPEGEVLPCAALAEPGVLGGLLDRFAARHGGADRRAVVSMWTQYYAVRLVYPVLAANLLLGRDLPLAPEETLLLVGPDGDPRGFCLAHEGGTVAAGGLERFAPLLRGHFAPLVAAVVAEGRIAPRLAWSNIGVRFASVAEMAEQQGLLSEAARADIDAVLERSCWPDGSPNPICGVYGAACGDTDRRRRVCCLRYLLPDFTGCGCTCPLPAGRGEALTRH
ncbi:siderophore-iron reductase FhuF [Pseudoroseomonas wenyumeiae]|uniref:Siderophore-iron reductase FhuF n=1 Tax=Teichococcus wenyumeiae TaxID=2478470 RepID=A0A3A9JFE8_9PROT|nr:siderophore-iron reductase FhuF [Pseudoroseomonas wenyumeiae]RKK06047.1 siderophore-iron reductase FhuF [Pseudoroseomonas wenyumeiae]RMI19564.1 siderophore-iron reductase FhuF [Pseudoroseomonas wenyumeiae]